MPINLDELLKDSTKYPDALEVNFGEQKMTVGELRQFTSSQMADIDKSRKQAESDAAAAAKARQEAMDLSQKAAQLYESLQTTKPATTSADDPFETDPLYAPVRSRLSERDKKIAEYDATIKKLNDTVNQLALIGGYDRWQRQFDAFPKDLRPKDKSLDDLVKYAAENKLLDRFGVPSVELALDRLSADQRLEAERKKAREEGAKEAENRLRATMQPKPNFSPSPATGKGGTPLEDFSQLTDKVYEDPELRSLVEGLNLQ